MSTVTYEYKVGMTCDGCSNAISRILCKIDGIQSYQTDVSKQQVLVTGAQSLDRSLIEEKLKKWAAASGKHVEFVKSC